MDSMNEDSHQSGLKMGNANGHRTEAPLRRLAVRSNGRISFVELVEIRYIEADGNYLRIFTAQEELVTREKISDMESTLAGTDLVRVHRSTIVNRRHIKELRPWPTGEYVIVMIGGKELTLSRGYKSAMPRLLTLQ